jgi:hypothetical protein
VTRVGYVSPFPFLFFTTTFSHFIPSHNRLAFSSTMAERADIKPNIEVQLYCIASRRGSS